MSAATMEKKQAGQSNGQSTTLANIDERSVTYVPVGEKDAIVLSVAQIEKFLCVKTRSGKIACREDIVKFMMLCKAQGLNPWVNDAYLVGYDTNDGPKFQLISAHQALLKRAELSAEYDGMASGVFVIQKDGTHQERPGDLVLEGETLVGGWARVHRRDRSVPSYDCLKLSTFSTGKSRWAADAAGMIVKCAEASALRKAFPSTLSQMYCREEMERQIEHGDREPTPSRPQSIASVCAALGKSKPIETTTQEVIEAHAEPDESQQEEFDWRVITDCIRAAGCEPTINHGEIHATLPNGQLLRICEVDPGPSEDISSGATALVIATEPDAVEQVRNICERSAKQASKK